MTMANHYATNFDVEMKEENLALEKVKEQLVELQIVVMKSEKALAEAKLKQYNDRNSDPPAS